MIQNTLSNIHSIVIDETHLGIKKLAVRIYDASNTLVMEIDATTDRASPGVVVIKNAFVPPAPPPPPPPISADGTAIAGGSGSLHTTDGTWSFGPLWPGSTTNWNILLNGTQAAGGGGSKLEVAKGGHMYALGVNSTWYLWQGGSWSPTADPNAAPPPPPPPPTMTIGFNPAAPQISDTVPAGTIVVSVRVAMSDESNPGNVTLSLSGPDAALFAVNGMDIVTARALAPSDDGTHSVAVTATAGAVTAQRDLFRS